MLRNLANRELGGYPKFLEEGHNENWVPLWLEQAGVDSYYVGKLMNHHNITHYNKPYPSGFKAHVSAPRDTSKR